MEAAQRDELFARASGAPDFRIERDADEQGQGYIQNSKRVLEEAFQTGTNVLSNMSGQRERIKVQSCFAWSQTQSIQHQQLTWSACQAPRMVCSTAGSATVTWVTPCKPDVFAACELQQGSGAWRVS